MPTLHDVFEKAHPGCVLPEPNPDRVMEVMRALWQVDGRVTAANVIGSIKVTSTPCHA